MSPFWALFLGLGAIYIVKTGMIQLFLQTLAAPAPTG